MNRVMLAIENSCLLIIICRKKKLSLEVKYLHVFIWVGRGAQLFGGNDTQQNGEAQSFRLAGENPYVSPLVEYLGLPTRKVLRRVLDLLTIVILKRLSESIFFQSSKFTAFKVKAEKHAKFK